MGRRNRSKRDHLQSLKRDGQPLPRAEVERLSALPRKQRDAETRVLREAERERQEADRGR